MRRQGLPPAWLTPLLLLLCSLQSPGATAGTLWPEERQHLTIGLRLFPACLAADTELAQRVDAEGQLRIIVVHPDDPDTAAEVVTSLQRLGRVRDWPLAVEAITPEELFRLPEQPLAAIFVAAPRFEAELLEEAVRRKALLFSPFRGDVERGVMAGISVSDRILPYVNLPQAERAGIRFKPFFLRAARQHE